MPTLNYTTKIPVARTVSEIQELLGQHGADAIMIRYADRKPVAVAFTLPSRSGPLGYTLPVNADAMRKSLIRQRDARQITGISHDTAADPEHAARVAWRVIKDWLAAQLSLVEAGQAQLDQVMLPYLRVDDDGTTLYQRYIEHGQRALGAGPAS